MKPLPKVKRIRKTIDWTQPLAALQEPATVDGDSCESLLWAAIYSLVDSYDQNITRENFCNLVMGAIRMCGIHSCAATLEVVRKHLADGTCSAEMLERSIAGNLMYTNKTREDVARQYQLVTECRSEEDPVQ